MKTLTRHPIKPREGGATHARRNRRRTSPLSLSEQLCAFGDGVPCGGGAADGIVAGLSTAMTITAIALSARPNAEFSGHHIGFRRNEGLPFPLASKRPSAGASQGAGSSNNVLDSASVAWTFSSNPQISPIWRPRSAARPDSQKYQTSPPLCRSACS
jgi:hypothetical protein